MKKRSYIYTTEQYPRDNFPLLENDDLASRLDLFWNQKRDGEPLENEDEAEEKLENGEELDEGAPEVIDQSTNIYDAAKGVEGLFYMPVDGGVSGGIAGGIAEEPNSILDNPYSTIYQNASKSIVNLEKMAQKFARLTHKTA
jgi:hypothetical protein